MFELGGLKDQGETTDRKSRNKVPVGSLKKEVRDDVPINISEGEFVLPADVVRYHGLEKIMNMRQNAKSGLELMNKMGQMGNSDEATLPDTIPFQPQNYQEGGAVVNPTGQSITSSVGAIDPNDMTLGLTGISSSFNIGTITIPDITVGFDGLSATFSVGAVDIFAYGDVDTGSNTSYSNISTGSNSSYSDVATGSNTSYSDAA